MTVECDTGTGIHTDFFWGRLIDIVSSAVVRAASGFALRDRDPDNDGTDQIGSEAVDTTAGTVTDNVILGLGDDVFNLTGGRFTGDIYGGNDVAASAADGDDTLDSTGGTLGGGVIKRASSNCDRPMETY